MDDYPTKSATGFLIAWLFEHLAKRGLVDGQQLLADLLSVADSSQSSPAEREAFQRWIRELWDSGVLPSTGE